jgi:hypothetical protein
MYRQYRVEAGDHLHLHDVSGSRVRLDRVTTTFHRQEQRLRRCAAASPLVLGNVIIRRLEILSGTSDLVLLRQHLGTTGLALVR